MWYLLTTLTLSFPHHGLIQTCRLCDATKDSFWRRFNYLLFTVNAASSANNVPHLTDEGTVWKAVSVCPAQPMTLQRYCHPCQGVQREINKNRTTHLDVNELWKEEPWFGGMLGLISSEPAYPLHRADLAVILGNIFTHKWKWSLKVSLSSYITKMEINLI